MSIPDERHAKLQALLQDRKTSKKGRASRYLDLILDADLAEALALARQELAEAEAERDDTFNETRKTDRRQGGTVPIDPVITERVEAAQAAADDAQTAADEATVRIVFVALKNDEFDQLTKEHPPRDSNEEDLEVGYNRDTFPDALMRACAAKVLDLDGNLLDVDPGDVIDGMSNGERVLACQVSNAVNMRVASVPSYGASSQSRQRSAGK